MEIFYTEKGKIIIRDNDLLVKFPDANAEEGRVDGIRVDADVLTKAYLKAEGTGSLQDVNNYLALKDKFIKKYQR